VVAAARPATDFPVVCVAGSAGGLDAYIRLLDHLPADMGVAVVIFNHPRIVATRLHELLPRHTKMSVELITDQLLIEPNHVFKPISKPRGWPDVIPVFLRSLTKHWGGKLIAVIVSGYDGDGAAALCGIKEVGGITIPQKLETAKASRHARERHCKRAYRLRTVTRGYRSGNSAHCSWHARNHGTRDHVAAELSPFRARRSGPL
jgi:two-component system, chemotaxis family, protein-glutamate methylesterase/glutaminase